MIRHLLKTEPLARPLLVCLAAAFASVFTFNVADPDLWGHVRYGADMLRLGRIFQTDPYSYTSGGFTWINHELVCEWTLGYIEPRFGAVGLQAWKVLMGAATVGCIVWAHRRSSFQPLTIVLIAALLAMNLRLGWVVRPQIFTYTFLSVLGLLMTEHGRGRRRVLWLAPPLMAAWTNSHGGFVAGLCVLAVHVAFAGWDELRRHTHGWIARTAALLLVLAATAAATLVNPYGVTLPVWLWDSLSWPRPEIAEWWPVPLWTLEYFAFKVMVAVALAGVAASRRPRAWSQVTILALVAVQAFLHRRHIPLFAILAAYWLPEHLDDGLRRLRDWLASRTPLMPLHAQPYSRPGAALFGLALLFVGLSAVQACQLRVDKAVYPVSAFRFIRERGLEGRMVTEFNWGQYCLYAFWPRILVSVDGRFDTSYSREVLDINLDFMMGDQPRWRHRSPATGPFCADRVLDVGNPNLALVDRQRSDCVRAIEQRPDWVLLYQDALAQVWGRRSVYDDPDSAHYLPPESRSITDDTQAGWVPYPAVPE
jgi:hypothetical protein